MICGRVLANVVMTSAWVRRCTSGIGAQSMNTLRSDRSDLVMMSDMPLMMTGWLLPSVTKRQRASDINTVRPDMLS